MPDIAENAPEPMHALLAVQTEAERAANLVRSMMRSFRSESGDKPWFNDREMWPKAWCGWP